METIELWDADNIPFAAKDDPFKPYMETYLLEGKKPVGAVLVCPGGGYGKRADHEGRPVAEFFNSRGLHAFVVHYRVSPSRHPAPLSDVCRALRLVRHRAERWGVLPDKLAVLGFSAGGHLTASIGVHYDLVKTDADDLCSHVSARPDAFVPCYAVLSSCEEFGHKGSFRNLLGENPDPQLFELMSLEKQVTSSTPPAFLWHTAEDPGVPVENSLAFCRQLSKHKVPFELHVFPNGPHGMGLAPQSPHVAQWADLCAKWLKEMGWS